MLPSGTMLNSSIRGNGSSRSGELQEKEDSSQGLGGFHSSIHIPGNVSVTIYYAVGVYSEILPNQQMNGIVAFDKPWKNVVATYYHELNEVRTDPDVEDATNVDESRLGWYSDGPDILGNHASGEIGDFPIDEANIFAARDLSTVFKEVSLTNGTGTVPIQLQYSNAVHGPEGPIAKPHSN